MNKGNNII